ncbi:MAG TPA: hypothetical protein VGN12_02445 [Pirellulales bacterium]|jgi:hypothetical protein
MILFSLIWSSVFLLAVWLVAASPTRLALAIVFSVVAFFATPMCMFYSPAVAFQVLFVLVATVICALRKAGPRAFRQSIIGATAAGYAAAAILAIVQQQQQQQLVEKYPFQSLAPRLAYEADTQLHPASAQVQTSRSLDSRWHEIVERQEQHFSIRHRALVQLHNKTLQGFLASPAFGVGRMTHLAREEWLARSDDVPVPQVTRLKDATASPEPGAVDSPPETQANASTEVSIKPNADLLWFAHQGAIEEFVAPERYGLIRGREEVAGFLAHRLGPHTNLVSRTQLPAPDRVELVSLFKFPDPRVYVSDNLPAMDELRDAPTRQLDDFEQQGLDALKKGEDIVSTNESSTIRALGSIRALKQCLQCHTTQEGELLGAFSYRWGSVKPSPQAVPPTPDAT